LHIELRHLPELHPGPPVTVLSEREWRTRYLPLLDCLDKLVQPLGEVPDSHRLAQAQLLVRLDLFHLLLLEDDEVRHELTSDDIEALTKL